MIINLLVKLDEGATAPKQMTNGAAGFDLVAHKDQKVYNKSYGKATAVHTGTYLEIPHGYVGLIFERSSLNKRKLSMANKVGVIDSDYRGEIIVQLYAEDHMVEIEAGDRIAQLVILELPRVELVITEKLNATDRNDGGFGSTGV